MIFGEVWETRHGPVMVVGRLQLAQIVHVLHLDTGAVIDMWMSELVRRLDE